MDQRSIGLLMQQYREKAGLSQEQLAEAVGLSAIFISFIERGVKKPSLDKFVEIVNVLNITADQLLVGVLKNGYKIRASKLTEILDTLPPDEQNRVLSVVEAMVQKP